VTDEEDHEGSFDDQVPEADGPAFRVEDAQVRAQKVAHVGKAYAEEVRPRHLSNHVTRTGKTRASRLWQSQRTMISS